MMLAKKIDPLKTKIISLRLYFLSSFAFLFSFGVHALEPFPTFEDQPMERSSKVTREQLLGGATVIEPYPCGDRPDYSYCVDYSALVQTKAEKLKEMILNFSDYQKNQIPCVEQSEVWPVAGLPDWALVFIKCNFFVGIKFMYFMDTERQSAIETDERFGYRFRQNDEKQATVPDAYNVTKKYLGSWYVEKFDPELPDVFYVRLRAGLESHKINFKLGNLYMIVKSRVRQVYERLGRPVGSNQFRTERADTEDRRDILPSQ